MTDGAHLAPSTSSPDSDFFSYFSDTELLVVNSLPWNCCFPPLLLLLLPFAWKTPWPCFRLSSALSLSQAASSSVWLSSPVQTTSYYADVCTSLGNTLTQDEPDHPFSPCVAKENSPNEGDEHLHTFPLTCVHRPAALPRNVCVFVGGGPPTVGNDSSILAVQTFSHAQALALYFMDKIIIW